MTELGLPERIEAYLRGLDDALQALPEGERRKIGMEINSHLAERAGQGTAALDAAVSALGPPQTLAQAFVDDYQLAGALTRPAPGPLMWAMLARAGRSVMAFLFGFTAALFYAFAISFVAVAVLKPIAPANVGGWRTPQGFDFGALFPAPQTDEIFGYWIIPLCLVLALIAYVIGTALLRGGARRLLRRKPHAALA